MNKNVIISFISFPGDLVPKTELIDLVPNQSLEVTSKFDPYSLV